MKKRIQLIIILLISTQNIIAQSLQNIIDLSSNAVNSTARSNAVGGAFTALGADFYSSNVNPAGIAMYRSPEISITPSFHLLNVNTNYYDNATNLSNNDFLVSHLGIVLTPNLQRTTYLDFLKHNRNNEKNNTSQPFVPKPRKVSFNFAISSVNLQNFNGEIQYSGINRDNSLMDRFVEQANSGSSDIYYEQLAADVSIIRNVDGNENVWGSTLQFADAADGINDLGVEQFTTITQTGGIRATNFTLAANIKDKYYVGANLGVSKLEFSRLLVYTEEDFENMIPEFEYFDIVDETVINANGLNASVGFSVKASEKIRFGISYTSPTKYINSFTFRTDFYSGLDTLGTYDSTYGIGINNYNVQTPGKINTGLAFINEKGFIALDAEYVDHKQSKFTFKTDDFEDDAELVAKALEREQLLNDEIRTELSETINFRLGTERVIKKFRVRAGLNYRSGIYAEEEQKKENLSYCAGFGWRFENIFIDFAGIFNENNSKIAPYSIENQEVISANVSQKQFLFNATLGARF